jgi:hypothetical protein
MDSLFEGIPANADSSCCDGHAEWRANVNKVS